MIIPANACARFAGSILGMLAGFVCWLFVFQPQSTPPILTTKIITTLSVPQNALRVEVRQKLPAPSAATTKAVINGNFVMLINSDDGDETTLIRAMLNRGGLVIAKQQGEFFVLNGDHRVPFSQSGVNWKEYSHQVWWIGGEAPAALGLPVAPGDRLCLIMPLSWTTELAGAIETILPEPITAYSKAHLLASETSSGYLNLTLKTVERREGAIQNINKVITGI
jgi:hypothetical protein